MGKAQGSWLITFRLFGVVLAALLVNSACLIWIFYTKSELLPGPEIRPNCGQGSPNQLRRDLNQLMSYSISLVQDFTKYLRNLSSTSCLFLKVNISTQQTSTALTELEWIEDWNMGSIYLTENKRHIQVDKAGWYLVFVQATFKLPSGNDTTHLRLQLNFNYPERTDQLAGAFDSRQLLNEEQDARLSFSVLVQMEQGNRLSVLAKHRDLIEYDLKPVSTFLTIIRWFE